MEMADSICILHVCRPLALCTWSKWKARFIQQSFWSQAGLRRYSFHLCLPRNGTFFRQPRPRAALVVGCPHDAMKIQSGSFFIRVSSLLPFRVSCPIYHSLRRAGAARSAGATERKNMIDVRGDTISHFLPAPHFFRSSLPLSHSNSVLLLSFSLPFSV